MQVDEYSLTPLEPGTRFEFVSLGETIETTVAESCGVSYRQGGFFYCIDCGKTNLGTAMGQEPPLPNHANHRVVWVCPAHGAEQP